MKGSDSETITSTFDDDDDECVNKGKLPVSI